LDDLKKQQDIHFRLAVERKIFLRNRKVRFFGECFIFDALYICIVLSCFSAESFGLLGQNNYIFLCVERRKIERSIRRLEKLHRSTSGGYVQDAEIGGQLNRLKEDLEYVRVSILYNPNPVSCVSRKNRRVLLFHNFFSVLSSATFPSYPIE